MAFFAVPTAAGSQMSSGPEALVRALIERDRDAKLATLLPERPDDDMRRHFTEAFNASWANAMSHSKDEPVLDGDIITGRQTVTRVIMKSAHAAETGDVAMVNTNVVYFDEAGSRKPHRTVVRFFLKREAGLWKVDDISSGDEPSIRTYFKTSYGR
ncbi:DUF3828 domain-containing protein [Methylobacterium crusticola]|uniref:DUF3828 domain-containing protein n=1 Tax=Methylobacterium crusticola TaxID=1697972 RepID=UPI001396CB80|nr:DUF3828 domain-containing protein [Methylobacterium crusticola]